MQVMTYSLELEGYSSAWVSTCPTGHNPNRTDTSGNSFGENIYYSWSSSQTTAFDKSVSVDATNAWENEVLQFQSSQINPFTYSSATGHYSQVLWATTYQVGCGIVECLDSRPTYSQFPYETIMVCNYRVAGNLVGGGSTMYTQGTGCSTCSSTCNTQYTSLCGQPKTSGVTSDKGSCGPYTPK